MNDIVTVLDLIKQVSVSVPSIIAGTMVLTAIQVYGGSTNIMVKDNVCNENCTFVLQTPTVGVIADNLVFNGLQ